MTDYKSTEPIAELVPPHVIAAWLRSVNFVLNIQEAMLLSEDVLRRDWDTPEEDKAWEDL